MSSIDVSGVGAQRPSRSPSKLGFVFDLDGTLIDSVYQHVLAWQEALEQAGIELSAWRIHRRVGMSGGLFVNALRREIGHPFHAEAGARMQETHSEAYLRRIDQIRALPGAKELLATLTQAGVPWAIAKSGRRRSAGHALKILQLDPETPLITRDDVERAKPDPDLFIAAAERLGVKVQHCMVVGDSVWDLLAARRAGALGVGVLSGGEGEDELIRAGAYRVYSDPADLLAHLDECGVRQGI